MYIRLANRSILSAQCPKCFTEGTYHITVNNNANSPLTILMLCKSCKYTNVHSGPKLNKKVIYLDQNCISEFGKIKARKKHDERFCQLYLITSSLVKKQLAVFPSSLFHTLETSYISNLMQRKDTQDAAESLACETRFKDPNSIVEMELTQKIYESNVPLSIDKILLGELNHWYAPRFKISLPFEHSDGKFRKLFAEKISYYLRLENRSQEDILNGLVDDYARNIIRSSMVRLFEEKKSSLRNALKNLTIFHIIAAILSELSHDFSTGRCKNVNKGMALDILMIAHTITYIDAILVDQEMHTLLNKSKYILEKYKKRIYSLKGIGGKGDIKAFVAFLNVIENNAPKYVYPPFKFNHAQLVEAYYKTT